MTAPALAVCTTPADITCLQSAVGRVSLVAARRIGAMTSPRSVEIVVRSRTPVRVLVVLLMCGQEMTGGGIYASSGPSVLDEIVQPARSVYGGDTNAGTMQRGVRQQHSPSLAALRNASLLLIAGASLYDPEEVGVADVLVGGGKVLRIGSVSRAAVWELGGEVLDARGLLMLPGLVDLHSHIAGGGGELGPGSRTPEAGVSAIIDAGITTVVGVLGTDGVGRSLEELSAKANALADDGLRVFTWSGSYGCCPPLSITGSAARDVQLLSRVLGTGELAISDHRSSWPSAQELLRLAEEVRVRTLSGSIISETLPRQNPALRRVRSKYETDGFPLY